MDLVKLAELSKYAPIHAFSDSRSDNALFAFFYRGVYHLYTCNVPSKIFLREEEIELLEPNKIMSHSIFQGSKEEIYSYLKAYADQHANQSSDQHMDKGILLLESSFPVGFSIKHAIQYAATLYRLNQDYLIHAKTDIVKK